MYNRYIGNTGKVERVGDTRRDAQSGRPGGGAARPRAEPQHEQPRHAERPPLPAPSSQRPPGPLSGLSGMVSEIMKKLSPQSLDTDDILLILILWLLYKESGDEEFLITMIAMFLL